jgi:hypothetical protein
MGKRGRGCEAVYHRPDGRWEGQIRIPGGGRRSFCARTRRDVIHRLTLRQQLQVAPRPKRRLRLRGRDRLLWIVVRRLQRDWRRYLLFVPPGDGDSLASAGLAFLLAVAIANPPRPPAPRSAP